MCPQLNCRIAKRPCLVLWEAFNNSAWSGVSCIASQYDKRPQQKNKQQQNEQDLQRNTNSLLGFHQAHPKRSLYVYIWREEAKKPNLSKLCIPCFCPITFTAIRIICVLSCLELFQNFAPQFFARLLLGQLLLVIFTISLRTWNHKIKAINYEKKRLNNRMEIEMHPSLQFSLLSLAHGFGLLHLLLCSNFLFLGRKDLPCTQGWSEMSTWTISLHPGWPPHWCHQVSEALHRHHHRHGCPTSYMVNK